MDQLELTCQSPLGIKGLILWLTTTSLNFGFFLLIVMLWILKRVSHLPCTMFWFFIVFPPALRIR